MSDLSRIHPSASGAGRRSNLHPLSAWSINSMRKYFLQREQRGNVVVIAIASTHEGHCGFASLDWNLSVWNFSDDLVSA